MSATVLPYLRDAAWAGWSQLAWTEPPGFEPSAWTPRLGFMVGAPGARRLLGPHDLGGTTPEALAAIAIQNLAMQPAQWQLLAKAGGVLGVGARPTVLEVRDELAVERMLVPAFVEAALRSLVAPGALFYAPMRGILRASLPGGEPAIEAAINKEKGDAVMAYDRTAAAGGEAVSAACFQVALGRPVEAVSSPGGRDRPYLPKLERVVPRLEAAQARLAWDTIPYRGLGADDDPHALRLTLGVRGPTRFHYLHQASYAALRTDFRSLERVALGMFERQLLAPEELAGAPVRIGGFRGLGAAEHLVVPGALLQLHRALSAATLRVVVPSEGVLAAVPVGAPIPDGDLLGHAAALGGGWVTLSGAVHFVENGHLQQSAAPR